MAPHFIMPLQANANSNITILLSQKPLCQIKSSINFPEGR